MSGLTGFGITQQGFVLPQLTDIQYDINQTLISTFGADINLGAESFFGQISGIFAEREALVWQAMQDVYNSQSPDTAFGASLDNVGALRGVPRLAAAYSTVQNVRLFGTVGTVVPGSGTNAFKASIQNSPTSIFALTGDTTLQAGANCVQTVQFSAVPASGTWQIALYGTETTVLAFNATASDIQAAIQLLDFASGCTVTGDYSSGFTITFNGAGTGGMMIQPAFTIPLNTLASAVPAAITITPTITTAGVDQANVTFTATSTGAIIANAGTLTVINTPISGVTALLNTQDATEGRDIESDNAYRARMDQELQVAGAGTVEAIRAKLLQVNGVTTVLVFENITDITDSAGRPPHSFECVVLGGSDADVAETIWLAKPAGIPTFGTSSYTITDSQGQPHLIYFSRPYAVSVYIIANLTVDSDYPSNGDELASTAMVTYGNSLGIGKELIVIPKLISQIAGIAGIQDAEILVGLTAGPTTSDNITPTAFQVLTFDTSRVQINHV
jgi:uncharacterized phage protein gp47/JayE